MFVTSNEEEIDELLYRQFIGRIGCQSGLVTYIVPISYAYDGKFIYAHALEGMKIGLMRQHTDVCFQVDSMPDIENWHSVICWGTFEEMINPDEREEALKRLHARALPRAASVTARLSASWPYLPRDINSIQGVVFRIRLYKKTGKSNQ